VSSRFAFIYSPSSRTALKYIVGRAFRAPNAYEEFYIDDVSIIAPAGPLRPETILSNEIVLERTLSGWLSMTADGYYNSLKDVIDEVASPDPGLSYFANDRHENAYGVELELDAKRASGLAARASYAFSDAREPTKNRHLTNSPLHQAKANLTVPIQRRAFGGLELLYFSEQQTYRGPTVPGSFLSNLTLSSKPIRQNWELSASCYNVLNHRWFSPLGPNDPEADVRMDGRTFRFKITYRLAHERK
jgi:iron complex outermembrane receptor protein